MRIVMCVCYICVTARGYIYNCGFSVCVCEDGEG